MTGTLLRDSKEETAYLEVSDTEIELWDSAAGQGAPRHGKVSPGAAWRGGCAAELRLDGSGRGRKQRADGGIFLLRRHLISCQFNIDTACVELVFDDGSRISIDCTAVENEVAVNRFQRSERNDLIYKNPLAYADLILNSKRNVLFE